MGGDSGDDREIVDELSAVLADYPKRGFGTATALLGVISDRLESLGVEGVDPERVLREELRDVLGQPLDEQGELLAAGWLLRMRPVHTAEQIATDLKGAPIGALNESSRSVLDGLHDGAKFAFCHVAVMCLRRWSEPWQHKQSRTPSSLIQPTKGRPSPRTLDVARALTAAIGVRFDTLAADPSLLKRRLAQWSGAAREVVDGVDSASKPSRVMSWFKRHRSWTLGGAVVLVIVVVLAAFVVSRSHTLGATAVVVYRPSSQPTASASPQNALPITCMESGASPRRDAHLCVSENLGPVWDPCFDAGSNTVACPTIRSSGPTESELELRVLTVSKSVSRQGGVKGLQVAVDTSIHDYRPWGLLLADRGDGKPRTCKVRYDSPSSDLPVRYTCSAAMVSYALDIQAIIDGGDRDSVASFGADYEVFDLNRDNPVWTVKAPTGNSGEFEDVEVVRAYF